MFDGQPKEIIIYETSDGVRPFTKWRDKLPREAQRRVRMRLTYVELGTLGNCKTVGEGVYEMKIDYGPGYRLYFAFAGTQLVLLLCGGDKSTQKADIKQAHKYWRDYQERLRA